MQVVCLCIQGNNWSDEYLGKMNAKFGSYGSVQHYVMETLSVEERKET
jgi:hypothetical protein